MAEVFFTMMFVQTVQQSLMSFYAYATQQAGNAAMC